MAIFRRQRRSVGLRSAPLANGQVVGQPEPHGRQRVFRWQNIPMVILGFGLLVLPSWVYAGKTTIDGTPLFFNMVTDWLHIPLNVPRVTSWEWYVALCWLPMLYSWVERRNVPVRRIEGALMWASFGVMVTWLAVSGTDVASTYLAVTNPELNAWQISKDVSTVPLLAAIWSGILTFGPEALGALLVTTLWGDGDGIS